jgi:hypothetical protein
MLFLLTFIDELEAMPSLFSDGMAFASLLSVGVFHGIYGRLNKTHLKQLIYPIN